VSIDYSLAAGGPLFSSVMCLILCAVIAHIERRTQAIKSDSDV